MISVLFFRCLPESPRWLITQGQNARAMKIVEEIAKKNGKVVPAFFEVNLKHYICHLSFLGGLLS